MNSAIFSGCGTWRYRLERDVQETGIVFAYFGINCSTATAEWNDQTVKKWIGFTHRNGGSRFIVGNVFAYRSTAVKGLAKATDPIGPENDNHLRRIVADADVLVPCWGSRRKLPEALRPRLEVVRGLLLASGKPIKVLGLTESGDPKHPMTLSYETPLVDWTTCN